MKIIKQQCNYTKTEKEVLLIVEILNSFEEECLAME